MFQQSFQALNRAIDRIALQLRSADDAQRNYLLEELTALRQVGQQFLESWIDLEDKMQDLYDRYEHPGKTQSSFAEPISDLPSIAVKPNDLLQLDLGHTLETGHGERWFRRGIGYFDLLMYKDARIEFERIVKLDPAMMVARLYLSLCYVAGGLGEEAERHLRVLTQTARDPAVKAAAHDARAQWLASCGRFQEAQAELQHTVKLRPDYLDAQLNLAVCSYACHAYEEALKHARAALMLDAKEVSAWRLAGASAHALGQEQEAMTCYLRALDLAPGSGPLLLEMGTLCLARRKPDQAKAWFRKAQADRRCYTASVTGLLESCLLLREYEQAVLFAKKLSCLAREPGSHLWKLGWALLCSGRLEESKQAFAAYESALGPCPETITGTARVLYQSGDREGAESLLREMIQSAERKGRAQGLTELGRLYLQTGVIGKAVRCFEGALAISRKYEDALIGLGAALLEWERKGHKSAYTSFLHTDTLTESHRLQQVDIDTDQDNTLHSI